MDQTTGQSSSSKASQIGWLFLTLFVLVVGCPVVIALSLPLINNLRGAPQSLAPAIQYDQDHVEELRSQIDNADWE